jgi:hypothetical protein
MVEWIGEAYFYPGLALPSCFKWHGAGIYPRGRRKGVIPK